MNKKIIGLSIFGILILITSCQSSDNSQKWPNGSIANNITQAEDAMRNESICDKIRDKIDSNMSNVILNPTTNVDELKRNMASNIVPDLFMEKVRHESGAAQQHVVLSNNEKWIGETEYHNVRIRFKEFIYSVSEKEGSFEHEDNTDKNISDDILLTKSMNIASGLNVLTEEMGNHQVKNMMVASRPVKIDGVQIDPSLPDNINVRPIQKMVFIFRNVGGIPVPEDRMVFIYNLQGEFRSMTSRWVNVNYSESKFDSSMSLEEFRDFMVKKIAQSGPPPDEVIKIGLRTYLKTEKMNDEEYKLKLVGSAVIKTKGMGQGIELIYDI